MDELQVMRALTELCKEMEALRHRLGLSIPDMARLMGIDAAELAVVEALSKRTTPPPRSS